MLLFCNCKGQEVRTIMQKGWKYSSAGNTGDPVIWCQQVYFKTETKFVFANKCLQGALMDKAKNSRILKERMRCNWNDAFIAVSKIVPSFPRSLLPISCISRRELYWEQPSVISDATLKFSEHYYINRCVRSSQGKWMRQSWSNDQWEGALKCTWLHRCYMLMFNHK